MTHEYKETSLWLSSLCDASDGLDVHRQRLRTEYNNFRSRIGVLVGKIQDDFPNLTLHDLTHIDELWRIASLITGPEFLINPLEAFVLGGAFLLHDAALCFEAYAGGRNAVRDTIEWKDAFAAESRRLSGIADEAECREAADFSAIRALHARQAVQLVERCWQQPNSQNGIYLIDDFHLRTHLGQLMGQIAASHHWNIEKVSSNFRTVFNAPGELPSEWQVDSVKIACLLRCADALHIDNKRAPDFLLALIRRKGISLDHWQSQNWLGCLSVDPSDPLKETALVTSTRAFPKDQAEAWWVAFDALTVADKEIKVANALLEKRTGSLAGGFRIKRVRGCDQPESMAEVVRTVGWNPCAAALHVDNIESLVRTLGGEQLYGKGNFLLGIVVRELIQNARDAVCARKEREPGYKGSIFISYDPGCQELMVEDDGVGMSYRVLTGPLLAFGTSFWASDLVRAEFTGLMASAFRPSGKFGIGFYSIFMIAESAIVASRRYDDSYDSTVQLEFPRGLTLRPTLQKGRIEGFSRSTRVALKLKPELMPDHQDLKRGSGFGLQEDNPVSMSLKDYVASLCASLDVDVSLSIVGEQECKIQRALPVATEFYESWLRQLSMADSKRSKQLDQYISAHARRLTPIFSDGKQIGLAAILTTQLQRPAEIIGRLTAGLLPTDVTDSSSHFFFGFIETSPNSARRDAVSLDFKAPVFVDWAKKQYEELIKWPLNDLERFFAAAGLAQFGIDTRPLARLLVLRENEQPAFMNFDQIAELLRTIPIAIYKSRVMNYAECHHNFPSYPGAALIRPFLAADWSRLEFTPDGIPSQNHGIIDLIHRTAIEKGMKIEWKVLTNVRSMEVFGYVDAVVASLVS